MLVQAASLLTFLLTGALAGPIDRRATCTDAKEIAACKAEIQTIRSHSAADAAKIPLAPLASRTFYITPAEAPLVVIGPVNVGVTAQTVRDELIVLATLLDAGVPPGSDSYIVNSNGTVTSDFIQTDRIALPAVHVREIHEFNDACEITKITGFVNGDLVDV